MAKRSRSIYLIAFLLFAGGLGYMIWSGVSQNGVYFLNVSEALAMEFRIITFCSSFWNSC